MAHVDFRIMATMNSGGDFGKKELSPALRNRFTEVWVPSIADYSEIMQIIDERLEHAGVSVLGSKLSPRINANDSPCGTRHSEWYG